MSLIYSMRLCLIAQEAAQHARALAAKSQNPSIRGVAIDAARIEISISEKNVGHFVTGSTALKELAAIVTKSRELGYQGIEFDARLALAEIEMKAGQLAAGRAHLSALEADAKTKGYNLVSRKAAAVRG